MPSLSLDKSAYSPGWMRRGMCRLLMYILILLLAGCGLIFPENEETASTSTPTDDSSGGDTGGSSGGGSSCTIASSSFEVVGGETAGQDWEGFAHVVDNSSQTGSIIRCCQVLISQILVTLHLLAAAPVKSLRCIGCACVH